MGAGGVVQQHAKILLIALTETSIYPMLSPLDQATVNSIDAKDPMSRTQTDVNTLYDLLGIVKC